MKSLSRYFVMGMMILVSGFFSAQSIAEESTLENMPLLEGQESSKQYLVQLSGTVMNETFSGAQVLLTLAGASPGSRYANTYLVSIQGYPKLNSRNTFFWTSGDSEMTTIANEITCDIKRTFVKKVQMYFQFISPELMKDFGKAYEAEKFAEKVSLPTEINARAGQLKLRIHSNSVSGSVWMKGYDPVQKAFVQYNAQLYGKKSNNLRPGQLLNRPIPLGKQ